MMRTVARVALATITAALLAQVCAPAEASVRPSTATAVALADPAGRGEGDTKEWNNTGS
jgi:hypothetical protein